MTHPRAFSLPARRLVLATVTALLSALVAVAPAVAAPSSAAASHSAVHPADASHDPFGPLVVRRQSGALRFVGRATDPDMRSHPLLVVIYLDGRSVATVRTHAVRGPRAQGVGADSAFAVHVPVTRGYAHIGCVWAVNVRQGHNSLLGCQRTDFTSHAPDPETPKERQLQAAVVTRARHQFAKPYRWGAEGPNAFDCSGLVQWTYRRGGFLTPRVAADQFAAAHMIPASKARPGDLVFYYNHVGYVHHVGIYVRPGMTIAAMSPALGIGWQPVAQTPGWDGSGVSYGSFTHR